MVEVPWRGRDDVVVQTTLATLHTVLWRMLSRIESLERRVTLLTERVSATADQREHP